MRLDLRPILHTPGACLPFAFELDLSGLDFYGRRPAARPLAVEGKVTNRAGALELEGRASTLLDLQCDRCCKAFTREKLLRLDTLLARELEDEEHEDEIFLLSGDEVDLDELVTTAFVLDMDTQNLCTPDCRGLCPRCGADLNQGPCACAPETDPRLAVLARLLEVEEVEKKE